MNQIETYTESELVLLLKQRQQNGFNYLYENYSSALYTVVLNIVPDREQANDILQEVFIKIWKQIDSYDSTKGRLFTWMMNITRNTGIDVLRSKTHRQDQQNFSLTENEYAQAGSVSVNTDQIGLRKAVHRLKKEFSVLVELSYFEGYTQDEISKMLKIPLGTVKTRMRSALTELKKIIKQ